VDPASNPTRRASLGWKWALRYGLATAVGVGILGAYVEGRLERALQDDARLLLELEVAELLAELRQMPGGGREQLAHMIEPELAGADPDLRFSFQVFARDGRERYGHGPLHDKAVALAPGILSREQATMFREIDLGDEYPYWVLCSDAGAEGYVRVAVNARVFIRAAERIRTVMLGMAPLALVLSGALGLALARGSLRPVREIVSAALRIRSGRLDEDIPRSGTGDEFDQIAAAFNQVLERVRSGMGALRRFSADAAHQLRSPLTALRSRIDVTLHTEVLASGMREFLEEMLGDVTQLSESVDAMLRLSHSEAGLDPEHRVEVEVGPLLRAVVEFFEPMAEQRQQALVLREEPIARVAGDVEWLRQLFVNLVDNALRFTPEGGRIEVDLAPGAGEVRVRVRDTGPGIPPEERERIFERFYGSGPRDGVVVRGLGLTIARTIARNHGGEIEVESAPGEGATFLVRLPALAGAAGKPAAALASRPASRSPVAPS
jgi:signal transduction histidine kinase